MVIITPRGEVVKSVISYDGGTASPRNFLHENIKEESASSLVDTDKVPHLRNSFKALSFVDKGTNVTERSFTNTNSAGTNKESVR